VIYEIINVNECTGKWQFDGKEVPYKMAKGKFRGKDGSGRTVPRDVEVKPWGAASCGENADCKDNADSSFPYKCTCRSGYTGKGSHAYRKFSEDVTELWGEKGYKNLMPAGYDHTNTNGAQGCLDNSGPIVECAEGPEVFEEFKVGCDCDDKMLATEQQWITHLNKQVKKLKLKDLCTVTDEQGDNSVSLTANVTVPENGTKPTGQKPLQLFYDTGVVRYEDKDCNARKDECYANIDVSATYADKNYAQQNFVLRFKFSGRDALQMVEKRLNITLHQMKQQQKADTDTVVSKVETTSKEVGDEIKGLTDCTSDLCTLMGLVKFNRLVVLFLFLCVVNGIHTQLIRAFIVGIGMGKYYYPLEDEKYHQGADLYLRVTRLGFMDAQERAAYSQNWWQTLADNDHGHTD